MIAGKIAAAVFLAISLFSCSAVIKIAGRDVIISRLDALAEYERKFVALSEALPRVAQFLVVEDILEVKQRRDMAYIYYWSAIAAIARGDLAYHDTVLRRANEEIDSAITLLRERLKEKTH